MPDIDLLEGIVTCPICNETWKILYRNSDHLKVFLKCHSCKECFAISPKNLETSS